LLAKVSSTDEVVSENKNTNMSNTTDTIIGIANALCTEGGLPALTAAEFQRFYSVPAVAHGVNVDSPSRALEAEHLPGLGAAMRLSILWHEGPEGLRAAETAATALGAARFTEWQAAAPTLATAATRLASLGGAR
jgi:hypothetical protein